MYFLENTPKNTVNRLIERCFGLKINQKDDLNGFEIAKQVLTLLDGNFAPALIFALNEMENAIKKSLGGEQKISSYFSAKNGVFSLNCEHDNKQNLEKAYAFFYEQRTTYFNLQLTSQSANLLIEKAEELTKAL